MSKTFYIQSIPDSWMFMMSAVVTIVTSALNLNNYADDLAFGEKKQCTPCYYYYSCHLSGFILIISSTENFLLLSLMQIVMHSSFLVSMTASGWRWIFTGSGSIEVLLLLGWLVFPGSYCGSRGLINDTDRDGDIHSATCRGDCAGLGELHA